MGCQVQSKLCHSYPHVTLSVQAVLVYELSTDLAEVTQVKLANDLYPGHLERSLFANLRVPLKLRYRNLGSMVHLNHLD